MLTITFKNDSYETCGRLVMPVGATRKESVDLATRYLRTNANTCSAHVIDDTTETVVTRATEWTKRNG